MLWVPRDFPPRGSPGPLPAFGEPLLGCGDHSPGDLWLPPVRVARSAEPFDFSFPETATTATSPCPRHRRARDGGRRWAGVARAARRSGDRRGNATATVTRAWRPAGDTPEPKGDVNSRIRAPWGFSHSAFPRSALYSHGPYLGNYSSMNNLKNYKNRRFHVCKRVCAWPFRLGTVAVQPAAGTGQSRGSGTAVRTAPGSAKAPQGAFWAFTPSQPP